MSPTYAKPLPRIDANGRPFWEAARRHELRLPKCDACGRLRVTFEPWCPRCGADASTWTALSGRGTVWSHCTFHRAYFESFAPELPYGVALVELEEGPRLVTNVIGLPREQVRIGLAVEAVFEDVTPEVTLVKFRPR